MHQVQATLEEALQKGVPGRATIRHNPPTMQEEKPALKEKKTKQNPLREQLASKCKKHSSKMKFKLHSPLQKFPASVFSLICCAEIRWMSLSQKLFHLKNMHKGTKCGERS
jgi:hypothetical protein